jgi:crotonobetainyl-CoA:carnitine CoA-transferase CaiB-like acyl-CoA transferase
MLPLDDVTILDLSRVMAGPFASMLLADFGAKVIKVEKPDGGDDTRGYGPPFVRGESTYFLSANRNKRSIAIDLKHEGGRALVRRLAARADVLLENFRPGTLDRLGLSYESLRADNPRLVYATISGFGHAGVPEWSGRAGYDLVLQGMGGIMSLTGPRDGAPYKTGTSIADLAAGIYGALGILVALHARARTGRGQHVDVSMLDAQISLLSYHAQACLCGEAPVRLGNAHPNVAPYETYRAADGFFNLGVGNDAHFETFARAIGRPELASDPRFARNADRVRRRDELNDVLAPLFAASRVEHWMGLFERAGVPAGPILSVGQVLAHPQARARDMVVDLQHPTIGALPTIGVPVRLAETPGRVVSPAPRLGEHGRAILDELGLDEAAVDDLAASGAVLLFERS